MLQNPAMDIGNAGIHASWQACKGETHVTIVGRGSQILILLASEDVNSNKMTLGVTVLASL